MDDMENYYVLVTGIKKTTTTDTIHNCFDNTKRFGVGNVYIVVRLNEGECEIFFKKDGDYKSIKGNTYTIDDTAVNVVEEGPAFDDRVFVENLNKSTTKDGLKCFIKAQTGHIIANISFNERCDMAIVEFGKKIDFTMVENACKEETLDNNQLEIKPVKSSSKIFVSGSKEISKDDLFFYFDNTRQSGGKDVTNLDRVDDITHLVQFSSPDCVIDVCKRKHFLKEQLLIVQPQSTFNPTSNICGISSNEQKVVGQQNKCRCAPLLFQDNINVETSLNTGLPSLNMLDLPKIYENAPETEIIKDLEFKPCSLPSQPTSLLHKTDTNNNCKMYNTLISTSEVHMDSDNNHKTEQSARLTPDIEKNIELNESKTCNQAELKSRQDGNEKENADAFVHYAVIAIRSYKARYLNELSFQEEDKFDVVGCESERWLIGDKNGLKGLFPSEYVKKCHFGVTNTILAEGNKCVIEVCKRKHFPKEQPLIVQLQSTFNPASNICGISSKNGNERNIVGQSNKCRCAPLLLQDNINVETSLNRDAHNKSNIYKTSISTSEVHMVSDINHNTEQSARLTKDIEENMKLNENKNHDQAEKKSSQDGNEKENADAFVHYAVIAIRSFKARYSNELSFQEEDKFDVVGCESKRWLIGDKNGLKGLFPTEYVKKCNFGVTNTILTEGKKHKTKTSCHGIPSISIIQHIRIPKGFTKREIRDCTVMPNGDCIVLDCSNSEMIMINQYDVISISKDLSRPMFLTSTEADVAVSSMDKQKIVFFDIYKRTVTRELQMNKTVLGMTNAHKQLLVRIDNMGCRFIRPNGQDSLIPIRGNFMPYIAEWNNNIFLTNWKTHEISCYNILGDLQWIFKDDRMKGPNGLATDNEGNVFIVGTYSHNILVISKNYKKTNEYEFTDACMKYPIAIDFDRKNSKFIVCNMTGTVKIFQVLR